MGWGVGELEGLWPCGERFVRYVNGSRVRELDVLGLAARGLGGKRELNLPSQALPRTMTNTSRTCHY